MMEFVKDYLSGENERMFFDLDFNYYLIQNYPEMEREDPDLLSASSIIFPRKELTVVTNYPTQSIKS